MPKITDRDTTRDLREYESEFFNGLGQPTWTSEHSEAIRASREVNYHSTPAKVLSVDIHYPDPNVPDIEEDAYPLVSVLTAILAILVVVAVGLWWWVR